MLTYETSTELLLKTQGQHLFVIGLMLFLLFLVILYFGGRIMAALDQANANLAVLAQNASVITAFVTGGGGTAGGATEAQVQALADGMKTVNNSVIQGVPGTTPIP